MIGSDPLSSDSFNLSIDQWTSSLGIDIGQNRDAFSGLNSLHDDWLATVGLSLAGFDGAFASNAAQNLYGALVSGIRFPSLYSADLIRAIRSSRLPDRRAGASFGTSLKGTASAGILSAGIGASPEASLSIEDALDLSGSAESLSDSLGVMLARTMGSDAATDTEVADSNTAVQGGPSAAIKGIPERALTGLGSGSSRAAIASPATQAGAQAAVKQSDSVATNEPAVVTLIPQYYSDANSASHSFDAPAHQPLINWLDKMRGDSSLFAERTSRADGVPLAHSPVSQLGDQLSTPLLPERVRVPTAQASGTESGALGKQMPSTPETDSRLITTSNGGLARSSLSSIGSDGSSSGDWRSAIGSPLVLEPFEGVTRSQGDDSDTIVDPGFERTGNSAALTSLGVSSLTAADRVAMYPDASGNRSSEGTSIPASRMLVGPSVGGGTEFGDQSEKSTGTQSSYSRVSIGLNDIQDRDQSSTREVRAGEQAQGSMMGHESVTMSESWVHESVTDMSPPLTQEGQDAIAITTTEREDIGGSGAGTSGYSIMKDAHHLSQGLGQIDLQSRFKSTSDIVAAEADRLVLGEGLGLEWEGALQPSITGRQTDSSGAMRSEVESNFVAQQYADDRIKYQDMLTVFPMLSRQGAEVAQVWDALLPPERLTAMLGARAQSSVVPLHSRDMTTSPELGDGEAISAGRGDEEIPNGRWNPSFNVFENRVSPMAVSPESQSGGLLSAVLGPLDGAFGSAARPSDSQDLVIPMSTLWSKRSSNARAGQESISAEQMRLDGIPFGAAHRFDLGEPSPSSNVEGVSESRAISAPPADNLRLTQLLRLLGTGPDSMLKSDMDMGAALNRFGQSALVANAALSANREQMTALNSPAVLPKPEVVAETPGADFLRLTQAPEDRSAAQLQALRSSSHADIGAIPDLGVQQNLEQESQSVIPQSRLGGSEGTPNDARLRDFVTGDSRWNGLSILPSELAAVLNRVTLGLPSVLEETILSNAIDLQLDADAIISRELPSGDSLILSAYLSSVLGEKVVVEPSLSSPPPMKQEFADIDLGRSSPRNDQGETERLPFGSAEGIGYLRSVQPSDDQRQRRKTDVPVIESQPKYGFSTRPLSLGDLTPLSSISDGDVGNVLPAYLMGEQATLGALEADSFEHSLLEPLTSISRTQLSGIEDLAADLALSSVRSPIRFDALNVSSLTPEHGRESGLLMPGFPLLDAPNVTSSLVSARSPRERGTDTGKTDSYDIVGLERQHLGAEAYSAYGSPALNDRSGTPVVRLRSQEVSEEQFDPRELIARDEIQRRGISVGGGPRRNALLSDAEGSQTASLFASGRLSSLPALAAEFTQLVHVSTDNSVEGLLAGMLGSSRGLDGGQISSSPGPRYDQRPGISSATDSLTGEKSIDGRTEIAQAKFATIGRSPLEMELRPEEASERQRLQAALPLFLQRGALTEPRAEEIRGALGSEAASSPMRSDRPQVAPDRPLGEIPAETLVARAFYPEARADTPALPRIVSPTLDDVDVSIKGLSDSLARMARSPQSLRDQESRHAGILQQPLLSREPVVRDLSGMAQDVYAATPESSSGSSHKSSRLVDLEKLEKASYFSQEVSAENRAFEMALMEIRWRLKFTERWDLERE